MKKLCPFFALLISLPWTVASQSLLTGKIVDARTDAPLQGAVVTTLVDSTSTNQEGIFQLKAATLPAELFVSLTGYEPMSFKTNRTQLHISLSPATINLNAVVVSSGTSPRQLNRTPASVSVITSTMLQRDAPFDLTTALNRTPGVLVHTGTFSTNRITLRGVGARTPYGTSKIKVYYENIPLTDGSGSSTLEDLDQELIGGITIIKGPAASTYGAGLGGVIQLDAPTPTPNTSAIRSGYSLGAFGTSRKLITATHHQKSFDLTATFSNLQSDGYRENSSLNKQQYGIRSSWRPSTHTTISALGIFTSLHGHIPSSINEEDFQNAPKKAAFTWKSAQGYEAYDKGLLGLTWKQTFTTPWILESTLFSSFRDAYEPRPFNILDENTQSVGNRTVATRNSKNWSLSLGTEVFLDRYQWKTFENEYSESSNGSVQGEQLAKFEERRKYLNAFAEIDWNISPELTLTTGMNFNSTHYDLSDQSHATTDQSGSYSFGTMLSPKAGLIWQASSAVSLFTNISHGFSPPTLEETLLPDGAINTEIAPETGWNYELGARVSNRQFQLDATAYFMHINDLLVAQRTAEDAYVGVNAGTNHHWGLDLSSNYYLPLTSSHTLNVFLNASLMRYRFIDFEHDGMDFSGNQLTGNPELLLNPGIELLTKKGLYGNLNGRFVGEMPMTDANDLYTDSYWLANIKLGYRKIWTNLELDVYGGVNNLTDTHYAGMVLINAQGFGGNAPRYYYPGNPRNAFAGVSLSWKIYQY